jgi:hypothetical protein
VRFNKRGLGAIATKLVRRTSIAAVVLAGTAAAAALSPAAASAKVLLVGSYHGISGQYTSIQDAVDAAKPGDWILIGPGDYKTTSSEAPKGGKQFPAGVLITKPNIFIRGMNRKTVIIDGTRPGSAPCSNKASAQNYGPLVKGHGEGLNGIEVWKADNVWVQNLTACNFLGGYDGQTGNEVWWNGGAGGGHIDGRSFVGSYLNATSTFFKNESTAASYGIFSSDRRAASSTMTTPATSTTPGFTSVVALSAAIRSSRTARPSSTQSATRAPTPVVRC